MKANANPFAGPLAMANSFANTKGAMTGAVKPDPFAGPLAMTNSIANTKNILPGAVKPNPPAVKPVTAPVKNISAGVPPVVNTVQGLLAQRMRFK